MSHRPADPDAGAAPRLLACGDAALTVEFGSTVAAALNDRVLALDAAVRAAAWPGVIETVPTYRSLTVTFDPLATDVEALALDMTVIATCWLSFEFVRAPRAGNDGEVAARGAYQVMALAAPYLAPRERQLLDHLAERYRT